MRKLLGCLVVSFSVLASGGASAQAFPSKPIRIILSYTSGGPTDMMSRLIGEKVSQSVGQPVLVESRAGANERVATQYVLSQPADGYTVLLVGPAHSVNPSLFEMNYDAQKQMKGLMHIVDIPPVISTNVDSGVKSIADLVKMAKAKPGEVTYGTAGNATNNHLTMEMLSLLTGIEMQHIPLKGDAPVMTEVLGNRIVAASNTLPGVLPHVKAGKLRALAVASPKRAPQLPDTPTLIEQGINMSTNTWFGYVVRTEVPDEIVKKLNAEFNAALAAPDVREKLLSVGMTPVGGSAESLTRMIHEAREQFAKLIKARGIKVQ
ncbi:MAG TPA: tripartite tricarboxylate transporter substrate binding protein [Burkholderiales bacterium]|nr:tripartite tricarboxylate transporter substrate binding protein [Burkholderiales bacterium]